jgi:hypothetical protein
MLARLCPIVWLPRRRVAATAGLVLLALFTSGLFSSVAPVMGQDPAPPEGEEAAVSTPLADDSAWIELQQWVSQLRGLSIEQDVPRVLLSPAAFRARQLAIYREYAEQDDLDSTRQLMVGLGMLEATDDLASLLFDLRGALPIGMYDPATSTLYVRSPTADDPLERVILAHEFVHALQDQHYRLQNLFPRPSDDPDRDLALTTLLEGDALIVQDMYRATTMPAEPAAQATFQEAQQRALEQVHREIRELVNLELVPPPVLQELYFPYLDGPRFIHAVVGTGALTTWGAYGPAMRELFANPPRSTAEILHPLRYQRGQGPLRVELPDLAAALGGEWWLRRHSVLGELAHQMLLARYLPSARAQEAAAGWAGNRTAVLLDGDRGGATLSDTRWDTPLDAAEWADAYAAWVEARYAGLAEVVWAEQGRLIWRLPGGALALQTRAQQTIVVTAPSVAIADALMDAAVVPPAASIPSILAALFQ